MIDWEQVARSVGIDAPPEELRKELAPLRSLEEAFAPLASKLARDEEPAVIFTPLAEQE